MQSDRELLDCLLDDFLLHHWGAGPGESDKVFNKVINEILKEFQRKPKERLKVYLDETVDKTWGIAVDCVSMGVTAYLDECNTKQEAIQWCQDRGLEIVE